MHEQKLSLKIAHIYMSISVFFEIVRFAIIRKFHLFLAFVNSMPLLAQISRILVLSEAISFDKKPISVTKNQFLLPMETKRARGEVYRTGFVTWQHPFHA